MKNLFKCILLLLASFVIGCSSDPASEKAYVTLNVSSLEFEAIGGDHSLTVTSSGEWSVVGETSWCKVSPSSAEKGCEVTVSVLGNTTTDVRSTVLSFKCATESVSLEIVQQGLAKAGYVDLRLEDEGVTTTYNPIDGRLIIEYATASAIPAVEVGKAFVLPENHDFGIRVITAGSASNNKLTLDTEQGNMCDLFQDIEFTLTSNPDLPEVQTRSAGHKIYTPAKIIGYTENGSVVLYDRATSTRDVELEVTYPIFELGQDFSGHKLMDNAAGTLYWEKCSYGISMDGVFNFSFGKEIRGGRIVGVPRKFSAELVGGYGADFLLKYELTKEYNQTEEQILEESILYKTFLFYVNGIPVPVTVDTHMGKRSEFSASAKITMEAGFALNGEARFGISFENGEVSPISSFQSSFTPHEPKMTVEGSLMSKASLFPSINIKLFDFIGPIIEPMAYVKEQLDVQGSLLEPEASYSSLLSCGMDLRLGLLMDFLLFGEREWKSDIINLKKQPLIAMPARLRPLLPTEGTVVHGYGTYVDVELCAEGYNYLTGGFFPLPGAWVSWGRMESEERGVLVSDSDGKVSTYGREGFYALCGSDRKLVYNPISDEVYSITWEGSDPDLDALFGD